MKADTVSSKRLVPKQKTEAESRGSLKFATLFAATDDPDLRKASTKQDRQAVGASRVVQTYAVGDAWVAQCFLILFVKDTYFHLSINGNPFLQSVPAKKKATAKTSLS